jgi:signal transduction histidine kinase
MNDSASIHVLLIEDSLGDALMVTRRLAREGPARNPIDVERASTLQRGLDLLGKGNTDVVLLDLHLPDSTGVDTVLRVREAFPHIPIVVFSSGGDPGVPIRSLQAGAQDYLGKGEFESEPLFHRLRAAIERMQIQDDQQRVQNQLEETDRLQSLGVLGAGASLGFNQLIGVILDHTEEALTELAGVPLASRAQLHLLEARKAALRAIELATELREYARAEVAVRSLDLSSFVLGERPQLEAIAGPGIEIEYELDSPGPTVTANPVDLRQVLFNLVINASESIRPASGRICIETGTLWADTELIATGRGVPHLGEGLYAQLCVTDSGRGLDAGLMSRIFDPFYTTKIAGRGLGLAAALSAVRRQGGWIGAGNESNGHGARFRVLLPVSA